MPKCPKCFYELVLFENRRKYKCSKCRNLFPQIDIDASEFRKWNKRQREDDWQNLKKKKDRPVLSKEEYRKRNLLAHKKWYLKNREKILAKKREYYERHRDTIVNQKRSYRMSLGEQKKKEQNEKRKVRRYKNIDDTRLNGRINYWKMRQMRLALKTFSDGPYKPYSDNIRDSLPTWALAELLKKRVRFKYLSKWIEMRTAIVIMKYLIPFRTQKSR